MSTPHDDFNQCSFCNWVAKPGDDEEVVILGTGALWCGQCQFGRVWVYGRRSDQWIRQRIATMRSVIAVVGEILDEGEHKASIDMELNHSVLQDLLRGLKCEQRRRQVEADEATT